MAAQPWFRLYYEALDDPKVGILTDSQFRTWVSVLMVQCAVGGDDGWTGLNVSGVSWRTRRDCSGDLPALVQLGLLGIDDDGIVFVPAWSTRQFKSDSSTERVKRYRERQALLQQQGGNVSCNVPKRLGVTPPETDTETEPDSENPPSPLAGGGVSVRKRKAQKSDGGPFAEIFPGFYAVYPRKRAVDDARKAWGQVVQTEADVEMLRRALPVAKAKWAAEGTDEKHIPYPASWLRSGDWKTLGLQNPPGSGSRRRTIQDDENEAMLREIGVLPPLPGTEAVNG